MGTHHFSEWYQEWSTHTLQSGANEETKMFTFRKVLPQALHEKILGVSSQPMTLDDLVKKAREFDHIWWLYSNPALTGSTSKPQGGFKNCATTMAEDGTQVNAFTQKFKKLSKEEKDRHFKNKLCLYCGKPGHMV